MSSTEFFQNVAKSLGKFANIFHFKKFCSSSWKIAHSSKLFKNHLNLKLSFKISILRKIIRKPSLMKWKRRCAEKKLNTFVEKEWKSMLLRAVLFYDFSRQITFELPTIFLSISFRLRLQFLLHNITNLYSMEGLRICWRPDVVMGKRKTQLL